MKSDGPAVPAGGVRGSIRATGPATAPSLKIDTAAAAGIDLECGGGMQPQGIVAQSGR